MLELHHVKLSKKRNKKAISNLIVTVMLVVVVFIAVLIFWAVARRLIQKSPQEEISCIELISSFSIKQACYLNENEVRVELNRDSDGQKINKLRFAFESSLWDVTGKKCSDVRTEGGRYGRYCEIIEEGQVVRYVFDMTGLEKKEEVKLAVGNKRLCSVGKKEIKGSC